MPETVENGTFIARYSRRKVAPLVLMSAVFVLICLAMVGFFGPVESDRMGPQAQILVGWLGIAFFGFALIMLSSRLVSGGLACRIDSAGVHEPKVSSRTIPWDKIEKVGVARVTSQWMIAVVLAGDYARSLSLIRRVLIAANESWFGFSIGLSPVGTDRTLDDYVEAARHWAGDKFDNHPHFGSAR